MTSTLVHDLALLPYQHCGRFLFPQLLGFYQLSFRDRFTHGA